MGWVDLIMIKALLLAIITVLAVVVAVKLLYALVLLAIVLLSAVFRCVGFVLRSVFWLIAELIAVPFRLTGMVLHPCCGGAPVSGLTLGTICRNAGCRCPNPGSARFCRQCGAALPTG
jgi:hypothetical protein